MTVYQFRRFAFGIVKWLLLGAVLLWAAFPIVFMVMSSFKPPGEIWAYPPGLWGSALTLSNYEEIGRYSPTYFRDLGNSLQVTLGGVLLTILTATAAAFVFSRIRTGWLKLPGLLIIVIRMFPPIVVIIPLFPLMSAFGLLDTVTPLILAGTAFSVSIATMLLKAFIDDIPVELEQAAMIDGCNQFQAFVRITLPLIAPGIAAVVVFVAVGLWNEYLFALIFTSTEARTAPVTIAIAMSNPDGARWGQLLAMSTIHLVPVVVLVMAVHKQLVQGMTTGAVKG
ncbi:carbohydrate ABC transporter permease [Devosia sp.]|uniref:carbohydrate ABC transporter permease n=1 Tax=Devosia sp. TaxID=1871048 RepID=UPI003F6FC220